MPKPASTKPLKSLRVSDIRGIAQLATQATEGAARIAEGVHQSVWNTIGVPGGKSPGQTRGITGLVYRSVHIVTQMVGNGVDKVLGRLQLLFESTEDVELGTPQREAVLAVLNGVMGDRLAGSDNPFATRMMFRYRDEELNQKVFSAMPEATGKVLLLVHGLCMNDLQWRAEHEENVVDHGDALALALGYTPVYLRYNSGLHTSQNGRELSAELEQLVTQWPTPIEEITVVAHSMGGLVTRSAVYYGRQEGLRWPGHLRNIVFLGTPHHGAPLEKAGNWVDAILGSTSYTAPFARLGKLRSAGITDLRYGHVLEEDWHGRDRFHRKPDNRQVVHLPDGVACYSAAATTAGQHSSLANRLIGDGLVPLHSALGQHDDERRNLAFTETSQRIFCRMNHTELLSDPEVTRQIVHWLSPCHQP